MFALVQRERILGFLVGNYLLIVFFHYFYILFSPGRSTFVGLAYLQFAVLSNAGIIIIIAGSISLLFAYLVPFRAARRTFTIGLFYVLILLTIADLGIYRIFKFHINSMVLTLLFTEGVEDSIHLGFQTVCTIISVLIIILLAEILLWRFVGRVHTKYHISGKSFALSLIFLIATICIDKTAYAVADLRNYQQITRYSKVFPLYQPLTIKRFVHRYFGVDTPGEFSSPGLNEYSGLRYPIAELQFEHREHYPNIIIIVIDGWRFDMLNPETTPNLWEFSKQAIVFQNHFSGGNATRFGIFSLMYGIYGYYWHHFLGERRAPVLIEVMQDLNYDFLVLSSSKLTNPEFRLTVFNPIGGSIIDTFPGRRAAEKDIQLTRTFTSWISQRTDPEPFFAFLFYDGPHSPYSYPSEFQKFVPAEPRPNFATVGEKDREALLNAYRNAICFDDAQVGEILKSLNDADELQESIVIVTADHGEEFYEAGYWGHTSSFSLYQTQVPFVMFLPGSEPTVVTSRSSHHDVVPTLLQFLGCTTPPENFASGRSLFNTKAEGAEWEFVSGWDEYAIISQDRTIVFSCEPYKPGRLEVRDSAYQLLLEPKEALRNSSDALHGILREFVTFLQ